MSKEDFCLDCSTQEKVQSICEQLQRVTEAKNKLIHEEKALKGIIDAYMNDECLSEIIGLTLKIIRPYTHKYVPDTDKLKADGLYEKYCKESEYYSIKVVDKNTVCKSK